MRLIKNNWEMHSYVIYQPSGFVVRKKNFKKKKKTI